MAEQNKKNVRIQHKIDTQSNWATYNTVLLKGEIGLESDTNLIKIGDGVKPWKQLPYVLEAELEEISDYINNEISNKTADRTLSNLTDNVTALGNIGAAKIDHADSDITYGPGTTTSYGHVRTAGRSGSGNYVQTRSDASPISNLNSASYTYTGQYALSFSGTVAGIPATLIEDSGTTPITIFYGVLTVDNYNTTGKASATYGVKQTLSIAKYGLTYERYCFINGSDEYGEWHNTATGASAYTKFITIPFDGWQVYNEGEYYYQNYTFSELEETDEIIIDVITSTDETAIPIEVEAYTKIGKVEYGDQYIKFIAYDASPLLDVTLKALVIKTK